MGLFDLNFMRTGFIKKAKFMASSSQRAQAAIMISETGLISREILPMDTGYMSAVSPGWKGSWLVTHSSKVSVKNKHGQVEDDPVLLISERDYLPLDPHGKLSLEDRERLASLSDVAQVKYDEAMASLGGEGLDSPRDRILMSVANIGMVVIGILAVSSFVLKMWGDK